MKYIKNLRAALSAIIDDLEIRCPHWTAETVQTNRVLVNDLWLTYSSNYGFEAVAALKFLAEH